MNQKNKFLYIVIAVIIFIAGIWIFMRPSDSYVGLTEAEAKQKATNEGRPLRVIERDGVQFIITLDENPNRVNIIVENDQVTSFEFY